MLIVFAGLPGTGKTTLAREVAKRRSAAYVRIDTIEACLVDGSLVGAQASLGPHGYRIAVAIAHDCLDIGIDVVVDAVNPISVVRSLWTDLAGRTDVTGRFVEVLCSDEREHRRRVELRRSDLPALVMPTWDEVVSRDYEEWTTPRTAIDNAGDVATSVDRIMRALERCDR